MEKDTESAKSPRIPWFEMLYDQGIVTAEITQHKYKGSGTDDDPYLVEWIHNDPRDPMNFPPWIKWSLTEIVSFATLAVSFVSSAYAGGIPAVMGDLGGNSEVNILGMCLFVLGFVPGPFLWAPMSELYGRQYVFLVTSTVHTIFNAAICASQNLATVLVLRFFAGVFGAYPLTGAGAVIADMFPPAQRGLAMTLFAAPPFLGPALGYIIGSFVGTAIGWRWLMGIMALFTGVVLIIAFLAFPETYAPVLLRKRATRLSKITGKVYKSRTDAEQGKISPGQAFKTALSRPWFLLFSEPIVLLLSLYMSIIFGTLYLMFAAFPIVYQEGRGWSQGVGGLAFLGVLIGMTTAIAYAVWDNKRYTNAVRRDPSGFASPEARLPPCCISGVVIPIGLFMFAWTNSPDIHWIASISAGAPFGFGMVLMFLAIVNYLIDAYTIFAASVLAANSLMRSLFGAFFPLFTTHMYRRLGIHWASSIPAFLALLCMPFPFIFYKYGPAIRKRCKFAAESDLLLRKVRAHVTRDEDKEDHGASA